MRGINPETEKIMLIIYRLEQGRYSDNEIAFMYNVHPNTIKAVRNVTSFVRGRVYRRR